MSILRSILLLTIKMTLTCSINPQLAHPMLLTQTLLQHSIVWCSIHSAQLRSNHRHYQPTNNIITIHAQYVDIYIYIYIYHYNLLIVWFALFSLLVHDYCLLLYYYCSTRQSIQHKIHCNLTESINWINNYHTDRFHSW